MPTIAADRLERIVEAIFKGAGCSDYEAQRTTELLLKANLRGHDSHGVLRVPGYVRSITGERTKLGVDIEIEKETPTTALINGNTGLGQVIATKSMEVAIQKAKENGISAVSVYNCQHIGRMADYAEMALEHDMIGIVLANTGPLGTVYGGMGPKLGTNPMCYAIPTKDEGPIIFDFATTVAPVGKVMVKHARGEDLPADWATDENGSPTTKTADLFGLPPRLFPLRGSLLPFGGSVAYKGFGLCLVVDILGGLLSGAGTGSARADDYIRFGGGNGVFLMAIDISRFQDVDAFKANVDQVIRNVKATPKAPGEFMNMEPGEILVPGDPERRREKKFLSEGIFVEDRTWNSILETAKEVGVNVENIK
jgi:uncharacterized oxidoreductase